MKEYDLPPGIVCSNQLLSDMARKLPRTLEELKGIDGMRNYQIAHFGDALLKAL